MTSARARRIAALEAQSGVIDSEAEAEAEARYGRFCALWDELVNTMTPAHREIIQADIDAGHLYPRPNGSILATTEAHPLTAHADLMVLDRFIGKGQGPFALPELIGDLLIEHGKHLSFVHDCERCGLMVPRLSGSMQIGPGSAHYATRRKLFDACPLCGGHVGYSAYYYTLNGQIGRCPDCDELRPTTPAEVAHLERNARTRCACEEQAA